MRGRMKSILLPLLVYMISVFVFNEFLIYYVIISSCDWPHLKTTKENDTPLRTMVLADPHLLGEQYGHWFDKLRREWQMYRSYQTALQLLNPDVVFILGDLTDEGKWASSEQWNRYVHRAGEVFFTPKKIRLHMVMGNHDVGFHYDITQSKLNRFLISFQSKNVQVLNIQDNVFVLVNSMGLEEDDCNMCADVESRLQYVSRSLKCSQNKDAESDECATLPQYPPYKPILLQHFPLYRSSDALCQGEDASSGKEYEKYKEKWDVVSRDASTRVILLTYATWQLVARLFLISRMVQH
ncbi:unnamed protein product [Clavelina lepadiformis]|uniref:Metallophosphoesterase 1 n=1 Tax=Clavelina lepadiformis TaxID=159417 RepID=A0ABP0GWS8_CLALP